MKELEDLLPPKPIAPLPSDCCGTGCSPCVHDIYEDDLKLWKEKCLSLCLRDQYVSNEQIITCSKYRSFELTSIQQITADTFIFNFRLPDNRSLGLQVGQHIVVKGCLNNKVIARPYTPISNLFNKGMFELMIKIYLHGKMSSIVSQWKVGDSIEMRGPYGSFMYKQNAFKRIVMLAAGTGIAPMLQLIKYILSNEEDYTKIHLMYSSRTFKDILLREELYSLQSYWNFTVCHYLSKEDDVSGKKYAEEVELRRVTKKDVEVEIVKGCVENTLILISGTKSFDKDMINAALNIPQVPENNIFKF